MPDFTSSLYLGMMHSSNELAGWPQLTTGVPAALYEPMQSIYTANHIAGMQGCEAGMIAPSTLHLYLDVFDFLSKQKITVFIDEKIYPVSKYGLEKLMVNGTSVHTFKHLNAKHLYELIVRKAERFTTPVVFTDGFCPQCGEAAPIKAYNTIIKSFKGKIIIDDTQAFGILGKRRDAFLYGYGGGGILQWMNISNENIVTIVSLAKAFGVPVAVIAGSSNFISALKKNSSIRESSSPVSIAHLSAAQNAITINTKWGNDRREKLFKNIAFVKRKLMHSGIQLIGGLLPVQSMAGLNTDETIELFKRLNANQFKTVVTKNHKAKKPTVTFIINYHHSLKELQSLADNITKALRLNSTLYFV